MKKIYATLLAAFSMITAFAQPAGWSYLRSITAVNTTATQAIGYQLRLTIDTQTPIGAGHMNANGDDIRFGKECNGSTLFNYWIESGINTTNTVIWVKLDTLPASGTVQFYMYYGNNSAAATSAISGTFVGPQSSTDSVTGGSPGGVTNSQRGFRFAPNEDILMTAVGKNEPTGTTRYVTLFNFSTQAILSQQQVSGPAAQYSYANITTPIWLTSGTQYLLEIYQGSSDGYYYGASPQAGQAITYYDMRYCNSCTENTFPTSSLGGMHYGYVDMWYFSKTTLASDPTVTLASEAAGLATVSTMNTSAVCESDSASLSVPVSGGVTPYTYSWSPAGGVSNPSIANPNASSVFSTTYTCTVTDACGSAVTCENVIPVNALPTVTANVSTDSVCIGSSFVPMGGGATTYSWTGGLTDNSPYTPTATDSYTVTGTDANGCSNSASVSVEVLPLPAVTASVTDNTICPGDSVTFTGSGANMYSWDNSVTDNMPYAPSSTTTFHVIGTDSYGCQNSDSVLVSVIAAPSVMIANTGAPFCSGQDSAMLSAIGADLYTWVPGPFAGAVVTVSPASSTTFIVTGLDTTTGCSASDSTLLVVYPVPSLAMTSDTVCVGGCDQLDAVPSGGTPGYTFGWTPAVGLSNPNIQNPLACNTVTMCYTATVTDANGCTDTQLACAYVDPLPVVSASGPSTTCVNDGNYTLSGTPAGGTFSGPGVSGNQFSPGTAGAGTQQVLYSYTDASGCTDNDTLFIVVSQCVGITDHNSADGIDAYPNPFGDQLIVNLTAQVNDVVITNSIGAVVYNEELNSGRSEINTSQFATGVYFMTVSNAKGTAVIKVVKQ